jgi:hypothetical protein
MLPVCSEKKVRAQQPDGTLLPEYQAGTIFPCFVTTQLVNEKHELSEKCQSPNSIDDRVSTPETTT